VFRYADYHLIRWEEDWTDKDPSDETVTAIPGVDATGLQPFQSNQKRFHSSSFEGSGIAAIEERSLTPFWARTRELANTAS